MEELTPREMELKLMDLGYDETYLETLPNSRIRAMYLEEYEDIIEE